MRVHVPICFMLALMSRLVTSSLWPLKCLSRVGSSWNTHRNHINTLIWESYFSGNHVLITTHQHRAHSRSFSLFSLFTPHLSAHCPKHKSCELFWDEHVMSRSRSEDNTQSYSSVSVAMDCRLFTAFILPAAVGARAHQPHSLFFFWFDWRLASSFKLHYRHLPDWKNLWIFPSYSCHFSPFVSL